MRERAAVGADNERQSVSVNGRSILMRQEVTFRVGIRGAVLACGLVLAPSYPQNDLSEHMSLRQSFVRRRRLFKLIRRGDWYLHPGFLDRSSKAFEFSNTRSSVIPDHLYAAPFSRRGLDTVGKRHASASFHRAQELGER